MIIFTGANGLVGANLVRALLSEYPLPGKSRLRASVHQDRRTLQGLDVELVQVDINNVAALQHAFILLFSFFLATGIFIFLFFYISCPNCLGEIVEWTGWALATWSLSGLAFSVWTFANLAPQARAHHRWYHSTFPQYPPERRALIPGCGELPRKWMKAGSRWSSKYSHIRIK